MAFAMFLGAGNLIFPPMVGHLAGDQLWLAAAGFLMTAVGLPLLGVIVISRVGGGFNEITRELPRQLVVLLGSCVFLIIGPLYAVPRTAMVAYEISISPYLTESNSSPRLIFSILFFAISWYFSLRPGKLLESVGKIITPALIVLLAIMGLSPIFMPQGTPGAAMPPYTETPFLTAFLEGYMTMDALAALMFGVVIMTNLKSHGITERSSMFRYSVYTGIIAAVGLGLVYISLFYLGATSREVVPDPSNGGHILTLYIGTLFGSMGSILLATVVTLACLTTAIGCLTAASEYFDEMTDKLSYGVIVTIMSIASVFFANLGLNQIIELFIPVLLIMYPLCIALILLGLIRDFLPNPTLTYRATLLIAFILSIIDVMSNIQHPILQAMLSPFSKLPGYDVNLSWVAPALTVMVATFFIGWNHRSPMQED